MQTDVLESLEHLQSLAEQNLALTNEQLNLDHSYSKDRLNSVKSKMVKFKEVKNEDKLRYDALDQQYRQLNQLYEDLKYRYEQEKAQEEMNRREELIRKQHELEETQLRSKQQSERLRQLEEQMEQTRKQHTDQQNDHEQKFQALHSQYQQLEQTSKKQQQEYQRLQLEYQQQEIDFHRLQQEKQQLEDKQFQFVREYKQFQEDRNSLESNLQQAIREKELECQHLKLQISQTEREHQQLKQEIWTQQQRISSLQKSLNLNHFDDRQSLSNPFETSPIVSTSLLENLSIEKRLRQASLVRLLLKHTEQLKLAWEHERNNSILLRQQLEALYVSEKKKNALLYQETSCFDHRTNDIQLANDRNKKKVTPSLNFSIEETISQLREENYQLLLQLRSLRIEYEISVLTLIEEKDAIRREKELLQERATSKGDISIKRDDANDKLLSSKEPISKKIVGIGENPLDPTMTDFSSTTRNSWILPSSDNVNTDERSLLEKNQTFLQSNFPLQGHLPSQTSFPNESYQGQQPSDIASLSNGHTSRKVFLSRNPLRMSLSVNETGNSTSSPQLKLEHLTDDKGQIKLLFKDEVNVSSSKCDESS